MRLEQLQRVLVVLWWGPTFLAAPLAIPHPFLVMDLSPTFWQDWPQIPVAPAVFYSILWTQEELNMLLWVNPNQWSHNPLWGSSGLKGLGTTLFTLYLLHLGDVISSASRINYLNSISGPFVRAFFSSSALRTSLLGSWWECDISTTHPQNTPLASCHTDLEYKNPLLTRQ